MERFYEKTGCSLHPVMPYQPTILLPPLPVPFVPVEGLFVPLPVVLLPPLLPGIVGPMWESGMLVSGTGTVIVSVGITVLLVVVGVVAGSVLAQAQAHRESAKTRPSIKIAIFFTGNPPKIKITALVLHRIEKLDRKNMPEK